MWLWRSGERGNSIQHLNMVNVSPSGVRSRPAVERSMEEDQEPPIREMEDKSVGEGDGTRRSSQIQLWRKLILPCVEFDAEISSVQLINRLELR